MGPANFVEWHEPLLGNKSRKPPGSPDPNPIRFFWLSIDDWMGINSLQGGHQQIHMYVLPWPSWPIFDDMQPSIVWIRWQGICPEMASSKIDGQGKMQIVRMFKCAGRPQQGSCVRAMDIEGL